MSVQRHLRTGLLCALAIVLGACSSGAGHLQTAGGQSTDPATVDFPIFYVKRYSVPQQPQTNDLTFLRFAVPSADLYKRTNASPSGVEANITARITGTGTKTAANYDVKDVSASADGTTILFAMRGPLTANMTKTADAHNEYLHVLRVLMLSFLKGSAPMIAIEMGRRAIPAHVRPSFDEMEKNCKGGAAEAAS